MSKILKYFEKAESKYNLKRSELFITSKLWNEFHKPEDVEPALKQSLMNLGLEYLDLYLMHWPFAFERKHQTEIHPVDFSQKVKKMPKTIFRSFSFLLSFCASLCASMYTQFRVPL